MMRYRHIFLRFAPSFLAWMGRQIGNYWAFLWENLSERKLGNTTQKAAVNGHSEWLVSSEAFDFKKHIAFSFSFLRLPPLAVKSGLEREREVKKITSSFRQNVLLFCFFLAEFRCTRGRKSQLSCLSLYWLWVILTPQKILKQLAANLSAECTSIQYLALAPRLYPPSPRTHTQTQSLSTPLQVFPSSLWWLSEPTGLEKAGFVGWKRRLVPRTTQALGPLGMHQIGLQKDTAWSMSLGSNSKPKTSG